VSHSAAAAVAHYCRYWTSLHIQCISALISAHILIIRHCSCLHLYLILQNDAQPLPPLAYSGIPGFGPDRIPVNSSHKHKRCEASLILIDRTIDLQTAVSHCGNLATRVMAVLPRSGAQCSSSSSSSNNSSNR
jgi:hypothetical protein